MSISLLAIFFASLLTPFFYRKYKRIVAIILSLLVLGVIGYFVSNLPQIIAGKTLSESIVWVESLDIQLTFYLDGLSLFFALLVTGMGLLVLVYSFAYMEHYRERHRFFAYLLLFMASMLGLVLAANLISLFVFWELTSFSSFLLIGFTNTNADSRRAARQALLVTSGGGLALMSGFILLSLMTDAGYFLPDLLNQSELILGHDLLTATLILIVIGAISKSAQFPLHFWLPNAMAAPTPVSAYLHSATMVKAGVYLILRLNPIFEDTVLWSHLLAITGAVTMTWGAFKALQEDDLKKILAYTTISALGIFFLVPVW
jgi:multicomponent Na+:H+ antiporter subunit A